MGCNGGCGKQRQALVAAGKAGDVKEVTKVVIVGLTMMAKNTFNTPKKAQQSKDNNNG